MEDYQRKMQTACNNCQAPHSLTQQLIAFFLYAWFEKKMEIVEREQNYFLLEIHLINWPQMQESTHEQVWSDLKQSKIPANSEKPYNLQPHAESSQYFSFPFRSFLMQFLPSITQTTFFNTKQGRMRMGMGI